LVSVVDGEVAGLRGVDADDVVGDAERRQLGVDLEKPRVEGPGLVREVVGLVDGEVAGGAGCGHGGHDDD
jgi:hypothetical protein